MLFREHKGSLNESMNTVKTVENLNDVWNIIKENFEPFGIKKELEISYYCIDNRINWKTYIITMPDYGVIGFTNGFLTEV